MTTKTKQPPLHLALGYSGLTDANVAADALAAHNGVKAHPEYFPNAPNLDTLLANIQALESSIAAAKDGARKRHLRRGRTVRQPSNRCVNSGITLKRTVRTILPS